MSRFAEFGNGKLKDSECDDTDDDQCPPQDSDFRESLFLQDNFDRFEIKRENERTQNDKKQATCNEPDDVSNLSFRN